MRTMGHITEEWPKGVVARTLNVSCAPIDVVETRTGHRAQCSGCGRSDSASAALDGGVREHVLAWADAHAERCRFLPRPAPRP